LSGYLQKSVRQRLTELRLDEFPAEVKEKMRSFGIIIETEVARTLKEAISAIEKIA